MRKNEGINVLSLFDGMSCGQIALRQLGVKILNYYASEIDKFAIQQTQHNFPDTIQMGNVVLLRYAMTWKENTVNRFYQSKWISERTKERFRQIYKIDWSSINLVLAGSPCQGFSYAGKQLAFNDPRSKLFFEFIKILNHIKRINPNVKFLLENVDMKRSHMRVISDYCGVFPVNINSNLVSAQNRNRWYWTNIRTKQVGIFGEIHSDISQPKDRGILLRDILEKNVDEKYYISQSVVDRINRKQYSKPAIDPDKTGTLNTKNNSGQMSIDSGTTFISVNGKAPTQRSPTGRCLDKKYNFQFIKLDKQGNPKKDQSKASCFTAGAHSAGNHSDMDLICVACLAPKRTEYGKQIRKAYEAGDIKEQRKNIQSLEPREYGKTNTLTSVQKDNLIIQLGRGFNKGGMHKDKTPTLTKNSWEHNNHVIQLNTSTESGGKQPYQQNRIYADYGIMPALTAELGGRNNISTKDRIRRLTPKEVSRLQTIPDWYEWIVSDTQIYKMCGNGWTVDVIVHILSFMFIEEFKQVTEQ
ncbi:DNA cytosine methyltransferase [Dysgonomonas sp. BGC7]|uniref:DNA cytosine methyltransferase n=1 Tax=Dysgonomonas sp. BGC7 TaxID=1658008 RepID=UPI000A5F79A3|nr:DNA cytosine methyltransferase [Dysgonomonas sp. BGC7]MBD8389641.1 DNA cytosine methyltransferase [Dysgonomonas sp. BGC7]